MHIDKFLFIWAPGILQFTTATLLEPVCCKKWQKVPTTKLVWGIGNCGLKVLNDTKLVLNDYEWPPNHLGLIWYHSKLLEQGKSRGPLFPKPVSWLGLFCSLLQKTGYKTIFSKHPVVPPKSSCNVHIFIDPFCLWTALPAGCSPRKKDQYSTQKSDAYH